MRNISIWMIIAIIFMVTTEIFAGKFGAKFGPNYSNIIQDGGSYKAKLGFHIGLVKYFYLHDICFLQVEMLYSTKGAIKNLFLLTCESNECLNLVKSKNVYQYQYHYIEIPFLLRYPIIVKNNKVLNILIGPQFSCLIDANRKNDADRLTEYTFEENIKKYTNQYDYGLIVGLEYPFSLSNFKLFIHARYNLNFISVNKHYDWDSGHH